MSYKWKPTRSQRRAFAERMANDEEFREAYYERKEKRAERRRQSSKFDYSTAGGWYVPTKVQFDAACELALKSPTNEQREACDIVIYGYLNKETVHHDYIHIINEYIRSK